MHRIAAAIAVALFAAPSLADRPSNHADRPSNHSVKLEFRTRLLGTGSGESGSEIVAYDRRSRRVFAINASSDTVDVFDLRALAHGGEQAPVLTFSVAAFGAAPNSIAVHDGVVAVAVEAIDKTAPGKVVFLPASIDEPGPTDEDALAVVEVGALPDFVTFTPKGRYLLVANEGEPSEDYTVDPEGSVSIIDLHRGVARATVTTADFSAWIGHENALRAKGVRIYGPNANAAQDLEPEGITVAWPNAYVTLQENNAIAVVDIRAGRVTAINALGFKQHSRKRSGLDASDRDGPSIQIANWPVLGMYQPDGIASFAFRDEVFLVTANEGDTRVYPTSDDAVPGLEEGDLFNEEVRVGSSDYVLDAAAFPNALDLKDSARLGRLTVTNQLGDRDGDGDFDTIHAFGARSVSVWKASSKKDRLPLSPLWDSGQDLEQITAAALPEFFNSNNDEVGLDDRSDNKGPEPEGLTVARLAGRQYVFVGLERIGGVVTYDVTSPHEPMCVGYVNSRDFGADVAGDSGPEGIEFIPASDSPTHTPLLLVGNEVSKTVAVFDVVPTGKRTSCR